MKKNNKETYAKIFAEAKTGASVNSLCKKHGVNSAAFYAWKSKAKSAGGYVSTGAPVVAPAVSTVTVAKQGEADAFWVFYGNPKTPAAKKMLADFLGL